MHAPCAVLNLEKSWGTMNIDYILTALSPAMFGERATVHIKAITVDDAAKGVNRNTKIMATRVTHERLARGQFPHADQTATRYASLTPGTTALHLLYRGPPVPDSGELPIGGALTPYLIEVEEYQEQED